MLEHFRSLVGERGAVYVSTPNVLTLAPEGASRSDNPWHVHEYRCEEFERLCRAHFATVEMYGLFHARKLRAHELALALGWDRRAPPPWPDAALLRLVHARDRRFGLRRCAPPATPTWTGRWTSSRCAGRDPALRRPSPAGVPRPRRAGDRPAHAHAIRRGLRDVAVRRGVAVGGDGRLLPAAAGPARRGRPADAVADAGPVRPARSPGRVRALRRVRAKACAGGTHEEDAAGLRAGGHEALALELERSCGDYARRAGEPARARRRSAGLVRPPRPVDVLGHSRDPAAAGHRRGRAAAGAQRRRRAPPPLRRAAGAAASGCPSARTRRGWCGRSRTPAWAPCAWS